MPANDKLTRTGKPTTAPTAPRSNASSRTSCAAATADDEHECEDEPKVDADFNLLAAAANLARLAALELRSTPTGWAVTPEQTGQRPSMAAQHPHERLPGHRRRRPVQPHRPTSTQEQA